jgi:hypothetical protein
MSIKMSIFRSLGEVFPKKAVVTDMVTNPKILEKNDCINFWGVFGGFSGKSGHVQIFMTFC